MRKVKWFLQHLVDPKGAISAPAFMGYVACIVGILGYFPIFHIQDTTTLFWQGLGALGIAGGETITNIAGTTFGRKP